MTYSLIRFRIPIRFRKIMIILRNMLSTIRKMTLIPISRSSLLSPIMLRISRKQPVQPDYNQYQPQQPVQPDYNQYQPQQPVQPDYNQYQNNAVQPYDYNQAGYQQPEYQQGSVYNPEPVDAPTGAAKAFGIVSFVCGIISMVACCYGVFAGIPGLIFAIISKSKFKGKNTMAQLGLIFSIIGLSLSVIWFIVAIVTGIVNGSSSGYSYRYY